MDENGHVALGRVRRQPPDPHLLLGDVEIARAVVEHAALRDRAELETPHQPPHDAARLGLQRELTHLPLRARRRGHENPLRRAREADAVGLAQIEGDPASRRRGDLAGGGIEQEDRERCVGAVGRDHKDALVVPPREAVAQVDIVQAARGQKLPHAAVEAEDIEPRRRVGPQDQRARGIRRDPDGRIVGGVARAGDAHGLDARAHIRGPVALLGAEEGKHAARREAADRRQREARSGELSGGRFHGGPLVFVRPRASAARAASAPGR